MEAVASLADLILGKFGILAPVRMSTYGYKRTSGITPAYVRFRAESGPSRDPCRTSAADPERTFAMPHADARWSPASLREKLVKIGA